MPRVYVCPDKEFQESKDALMRLLEAIPSMSQRQIEELTPLAQRLGHHEAFLTFSAKKAADALEKLAEAGRRAAERINRVGIG